MAPRRSDSLNPTAKKAGADYPAILPLLGILSALLLAQPAKAQLKEISTGANSSVKVWAAQPHHAKALVVLFPGGNGEIERGEKNLTKNFLVRVRAEFLDRNCSVVIIGTPSWAKRGYSDQDRISPAHLRDVEAALHQLNPRQLPVFLVGTSRGTISAAHVAAKSRSPEIWGLILTSSVAKNPTFRNLSFGDVSTPVLFIHHREDQCRSSPFPETLSLWKRLDRSTYREFIAIKGGVPVSTDPCSARTQHGFWQREDGVVEAIDAFISSRLEYSTEIRAR